MSGDENVDPALSAYMKTFGLSRADLFEDPSASEAHVVVAASRDYLVDRPGAFRVEARRCALVVVDMQVGFVRRQSPQWIPQAERMVRPLSDFAELCRRSGIPVIFTSANFLDPSPNDALAFTNAIAQGNLAEGAKGLEVLPELLRDGDEVISTKRTYDSFYQTDLEYRLRGRRRDTVIVTGTMTNFCCEATARNAFDRGFHVVFPSDLNATDDALCHEGTLRTLRRGYARVMTSQALTAMIRAE